MNKNLIILLLMILLTQSVFSYNETAKRLEMYEAYNKLDYEKVYNISNFLINNLPKNTVNAKFMIAYYFNALSCYVNQDYEQCIAKMQIVKSKLNDIPQSKKGDILIVNNSVKPQFYYLCYLLENKGFSIMNSSEIDKYFTDTNNNAKLEGDFHHYKTFYEFKLGDYDNAFRTNMETIVIYLKGFERINNVNIVFEPDFNVMSVEKFIMCMKLKEYQEAKEIIQKYKISKAEDLWPVDEVSMELWISIYYALINDDLEGRKYFNQAIEKAKQNNINLDLENILNLRFRFEFTNEELSIIDNIDKDKNKD